MKKLIIFDMDGVIIDVSSSYRDSVRKTVSIFLRPCLNSAMLPDPLFNLSDLAFLKGTGGLNNDWDLTHKVITLMFSKIQGKKESKNREEWDVRELAFFLKSSDKPIEHLFNEAGKLNFKEVDFFYKGNIKSDVGSGNIIKQIFQEVYLGEMLFSKTYGFPAQYYFGDGFILKEKLLIEKKMLSFLAEANTLAIATGRPEMEALYPVKKHNINFFKKILTLDDCTKAEKEEYEKNSIKVSLGKPNPFMLDAIAAYYENSGELPQKLYYIGDMPDDMIAAKQSKYIFCAVGVTYSAPDKKNSESRLKEAGADYIVNSPQELADFFNR